MSSNNVILASVFEVDALDRDHPFISSTAPTIKDWKTRLKDEIALVKQLAAILRGPVGSCSQNPKVNELFLKVKKSSVNFIEVANYLDQHARTIFELLIEDRDIPTTRAVFKRSKSSEDLEALEKEGSTESSVTEEGSTDIKKRISSVAEDKIAEERRGRVKKKRDDNMKKANSSFIPKYSQIKKEETPLKTQNSDSKFQRAASFSDFIVKETIETQLLKQDLPLSFKLKLEGPFKNELINYIINFPEEFLSINNENLSDSYKQLILESFTYGDRKKIIDDLKSNKKQGYHLESVILIERMLLGHENDKAIKQLEGLVKSLIELGENEEIVVKKQNENARIESSETLTDEELIYKIQVEKIKAWTKALREEENWKKLIIAANPDTVDAIVMKISAIKNADLRHTIFDRLFESSGGAVVNALQKKYLKSFSQNKSVMKSDINERFIGTVFGLYAQIQTNIMKIKRSKTPHGRADNTLEGAALRELHILRESLIHYPETCMRLFKELETSKPPLYDLFKPVTYMAHLMSVNETLNAEPEDSPFKKLYFSLTDTEKVAIYGYSLGDFEAINKALRKAKGKEINENSLSAFKLVGKYSSIKKRQLRDYIAAIKSGMAKLPELELKEGETVYRAIISKISSDWEDENFQNSKGIYKDYAFSSASVLPVHKRPGGWRLLEFKQKDAQDKVFRHARCLGPLAALREREVLFSPGQECEIVKENKEFVRPKLAETGYALRVL